MASSMLLWHDHPHGKIQVIDANFQDQFDGLFLSNGPGDPMMCEVRPHTVLSSMQRVTCLCRGQCLERPLKS